MDTDKKKSVRARYSVRAAERLGASGGQRTAPPTTEYLARSASVFIGVQPWWKLLVVQDLGEADSFSRLALARQQTLDVHQTARIAGDDVFRAGLGGGGAFHFAHRGRDHRKFRGKRAAETAARNLGHLDQL